MIAPFVSALAWIFVAAAPAGVQSDTPIRSVVYKVSIQQRNEAHIERYNSIDRGIATFTDDGTVDVDIMVKTETILGVRVTEEMRSRGYPASFTGNVGPDDGVHFPDGSINEVSYNLLRFFGVRFAADQSLAVGSVWTTPTGIQYTVKSADGRRVTLDVLQHVKVANTVSSVVVYGTVVYDPGLLVPISGDLTQHRIELHPEGAVETYQEMQFVRQSDSFDAPKQ
jgi:hypothetical protein